LFGFNNEQPLTGVVYYDTQIFAGFRCKRNPVFIW